MKKFFTFISVVCVIMVASGVSVWAAGVKMSVSNPMAATDGQMWADTGKAWVEAVMQRAGDKVSFKEYHGGALISGFGNQPKGIGSGIADFGSVITAYNPSEFPMDTIASAVHPAIGRTSLQAVYIDRILFEEIPAFQEQYTKSNLVRVWVLGGNSFQFFTTRPVKSLEDFKGVKVRCYGIYQPRVMKAVGAVPVALSYGEILDGLHKKVIDATLINPVNGRDAGYGEVAKHLTMLGDAGLGVWLNAGLGFVMNRDKWNGLPPELRRIMMEEAMKVEVQYPIDSAKVILPKAIDDLKKIGVKVDYLPQSAMDEWAKKCPDFFTELADQLDKKGLPGTQAIKRLKELYAMPMPELEALYEQVWEKKMATLK